MALLSLGSLWQRGKEAVSGYLKRRLPWTGEAKQAWEPITQRARQLAQPIQRRIVEPIQRQYEKERPFIEAQARERLATPPQLPLSQFLGKTDIGKRITEAVEKPSFRMSPLGIPVGPEIHPGRLLTSMLKETPGMEAVRAKMGRGEKLTPQERRTAQQESMMFLADIASGVKPITKGLPEPIFDKAGVRKSIKETQGRIKWLQEDLPKQSKEHKAISLDQIEKMKADVIRHKKSLVEYGKKVLKAPEAIPTPGVKERGFIKTIKEAPTTGPEVAGRVEGLYEPITNVETLQRAKKVISSNYDEAKRIVMSEAPPTAETNAIAQELVRKAQNAGRFDEAVDIVEQTARKATTQGQSIQALSLWNRLSPEGILRYAGKQLDNIGKKVSPELAESLTKKAKDIDGMTNPIAKQEATKQMIQEIADEIPPKVSDYLDELRYNNILSSPRTHIVNTFSNMIQTMFTNPATRAMQAGVDFVESGLTGKQREVYLREVPEYYRGTFRNFGEAISGFMDTVKGGTKIERPDIAVKELRAPTKWPSIMKMPTRILEASDRFFMALLGGGEEAALGYRAGKGGLPMGDLADIAEQKASYYLYRQPIDVKGAKTGQGKVLQNIDRFTDAICKMRKVPGIKWFIPFVQTPMNIMKQMVEYSPAGFTTMIGAKNRQEQLAKALLGSMGMAAGAYAVFNHETAWSAPTSKKEKEEFYASGRMPYSIRIGDRWVQINQLGPSSIMLAFPMILKERMEKGKLSDTAIEKMGSVMGGLGKFMSDQTYLKGIGDLVKTLQGDMYAMNQTITNIPRQLIPMSSLAGWAARIIDPVYRDPDKANVVQTIKAGLPFLSKQIKPYLQPGGEEARRPYPLGEAISPVKVKPAVERYEKSYQQYQLEKTTRVNRKETKSIVLDVLEGRRGNFKDYEPIDIAESVFSVVMDKSKEDRRATYDKIVSTLDDKAKEEMDRIKEYQNMGVIKKDRDLLLVPEEDRVQAIFDRIMDLSQKNRKKKYDLLVEAGIITPDMIPELDKIKSNYVTK